MIDEGYIKFQCNWKPSPALEEEAIRSINACRQRLYQLGLIGAYENEIGYGNISQRLTGDRFIISGSATGNIPVLDKSHYSIVYQVDVAKNEVHCEGPIKASSESMSHAIIYKENPNIQAVIHVHHLEMWQKLLHCVPTTAANVSYGTPEMAAEIVRLMQESNLLEKKLFVTAGHKEGIFTFGERLEIAEKLIINKFNKHTFYDDKK